MSSDLQLQTLLLYKALLDASEDWGGKLVLCCGVRCALSGASAAASIAGAATLAVDPDQSAVKAAMRRGEVDFVVNTLDEALRTLKNEIRQRRPLSVGLIADTDAAVNEMVERGVQPEMLLIVPPQDLQETLGCSGIEQLIARGMAYRFVQTAPVDERPFAPARSLAGQSQSACFFPAADISALRALDAALLTAIPSGDLVRKHWLERLPRYLPAARTGRWVWLNDEEIASLAQSALHPTRKLT